MKKISKTISIMMLMMMVIGLFPNVSFAKAPEAIQMSLTAKEMECIVGGGGGDKKEEDPPTNPSDPSDSEIPDQFRRTGFTYVNKNHDHRIEYGASEYGVSPKNLSETENALIPKTLSTTISKFYLASGDFDLLEGMGVSVKRNKSTTEAWSKTIVLDIPPMHYALTIIRETKDVNAYSALAKYYVDGVCLETIKTSAIIRESSAPYYTWEMRPNDFNGN